MVLLCAAPHCKERFRRNGLTFHRFPLTKQRLLKEWISALKREDFQPDKTSFICEKHFKSEDYEVGRVRNRLKPNAVPCLFSTSDTNGEKKRARGKMTKAQKREEFVKNIALEHSYCVQFNDGQQVIAPMEVKNVSQRQFKAARQRLRCKEKEVQKMVDDFYLRKSQDGTREVLNPWQSRVIEACFMIPVICDLEEV